MAGVPGDWLLDDDIKRFSEYYRRRLVIRELAPKLARVFADQVVHFLHDEILCASAHSTLKTRG